MPELYEVSIRKWEDNFANSKPHLDFSDGARVGDLAVDISVQPNNIWKCFDNTIGSPKWIRQEGVANIELLDNASTDVIIGDATLEKQVVMTYTLTGTNVSHEGIMRICSGYNNEIIIDDEFGGIKPAFNVRTIGRVENGNTVITFDLSSGVGSDLFLEYNIVSRL